MTRQCAGPGCTNDFDPVVHNQRYCNGECKRNAKNGANRKAFTQDVADAIAKSVAPAYLDELDSAEEVDFLKKEVVRLARLVSRHKVIKHQAVDAVYQAALEAFTDVDMPVVPAPRLPRGGGEEEVAVAVCADFQLGKVTPTYNSDICRDRIAKYTDHIIRISNVQRADHPVRDIHLWFLGDIVEGEDIFPGQSHLIDSSLYRQVGVNGPEIIRDMILSLLTEFENVHFVGVIGNHGCHNTDTRILTQDGFKSIDEFNPAVDLVLSVDDNGNRLWETASEVIDYNYTGNMYEVKNQDMAFSVTENHRIVGLHEANSEWIVNTPDSLPWRQQVYVSAQNGSPDLESFDLSPDEMDDRIKLTAWAMTDSSYAAGYWTFYQSEPKEGRIKDLLDRTGLDYNVTVRNRDITEIMGKTLLSNPKPQHEFRLTKASSELVTKYVGGTDKTMPEWAHAMSQRQVTVLLDEWVYCDGSLPNGESKTIYCSRESVRRDLMTLLIANGHHVSEVEYRPTHWKLNISKRPLAGLLRKSVTKRYTENERVWCLTVPSGRFFVELDGKVHLSGNSIGGRNRREYNSETNMDRLLYKIVEHMFAYEPRVTFDIPDGHGESNFYAVDTIGDYGTLLIHGDQLPPPTSSHAYFKKVMGWKDGAIPQPFNDVFMGHYHQNCKMTLGSSILRISGSPESYNTYAQEVLGVMGRPSQHLQFVHPRNGITSEHTIFLDD